MAVVQKSAREIEIMREAGRIAAEALRRAGDVVRPGATTLELDRAAADYIRSKGATCEFNGFRGYPANVCASVNEEVVHGIPSAKRRLAEGDIVGIDVGVRHRGYVGDNARTFAVGEVSEKTRKLLVATEESLDAAVLAIRPGAKLWEVSEAVQRRAEQDGFGIVREYAGHGIGTDMHEDPQIPNYVDRQAKYASLLLRPGMVLCIEPMLNAGGDEVKVLEDGWTVVTRDRSLSAHFEYMIAVTEDGSEVLTPFPV